METTESISKKSTLKNILLTVLGIGALSAGYFVFDQVKENNLLQDQLAKQYIYAENNEKSFAAIENNLSEVAARAGVVMDMRNENVTPIVEERIVKEIEVIDELMNQNNDIIKNLTATLGEKDERLLKFRNTVSLLKKRMNEYKTRGNVYVAESQALKMDLLEANKQGSELQNEVTGLKQEIASQDEEIDSKAQMIGWQSDELARKETKIRTAYYVVGTYQELSENNVVEKTGGFIGIGRSKSLKRDFNRNAFHEIDIYSYTSIPVFGGDISILTNHNTDSYELSKDSQGNIKWIKITDPGKFWESSKYLVVSSNKPMYEGKERPIDQKGY